MLYQGFVLEFTIHFPVGAKESAKDKILKRISGRHRLHRKSGSQEILLILTFPRKFNHS